MSPGHGLHFATISALDMSVRRVRTTETLLKNRFCFFNPNTKYLDTLGFDKIDQLPHLSGDASTCRRFCRLYRWKPLCIDVQRRICQRHSCLVPADVISCSFLQNRRSNPPPKSPPPSPSTRAAPATLCTTRRRLTSFWRGSTSAS